MSNKQERYFPPILATLFVFFFLWMSLHPVSRQVWIAETIPVLLVFLVLVVTYRWFRFSNAAYLLMSIWLVMHTIGGHFTFAHVPFEWVSDTFGFQRNHYDRVAHFAVGLYAFAMAEWLLRKKYCGFWLAIAFSLCFIMSIAAAYEIIEWWYAASNGGEAGIEFLGSQGDPWDAQRDMLADTLGAITALLLFWRLRPDRSMAADEAG